MGRYEEALPLLEESMKTREKYLGRDNVITATAYQRFALALCMNGCMKDAYDYINKAVDIYRKESGNNTTDMAITYGAYAILERRNNNIKNAEKLHKKGIDIITKLYNPHHPRLLQFYEELADTYLYFAEAENALVYYKKAMEVGREFLNKENCKLHDLEKRICEASSLSF